MTICPKISNKKWNYWCNKTTIIDNFQPWIYNCGISGGTPSYNGSVHGCIYPIQYMKKFIKCTEWTGLIDKKTMTIFIEYGVKVEDKCSRLFPKDAKNGPEPDGLGVCSYDPPAPCGESGWALVCPTGGCCCNIFSCDCNDCEGTPIPNGSGKDGRCMITKSTCSPANDWQYCLNQTNIPQGDWCAYGRCALADPPVKGGKPVPPGQVCAAKCACGGSCET